MYHSNQNREPRVILLQAESCNNGVSLISRSMAASLQKEGKSVLLVTDSPRKGIPHRSGKLSLADLLCELKSADFIRISRERTAEWHQLVGRYDFILLDSIQGCDTLVDEYILVLPPNDRELLRSFGFFKSNLHNYLERPCYLIMNGAGTTVTADSLEKTPLALFTNLTWQGFGVSPHCLGTLPLLKTTAREDSAVTDDEEWFLNVIQKAAMFLCSSRLPMVSWQRHYNCNRKSNVMDINN